MAIIDGNENNDYSLREDGYGLEEDEYAHPQSYSLAMNDGSACDDDINSTCTGKNNHHNHCAGNSNNTTSTSDHEVNSGHVNSDGPAELGVLVDNSFERDIGNHKFELMYTSLAYRRGRR